MVLIVSVKRQHLFSWGLSLEHIDSEQRMGALSAKQRKQPPLEAWREGLAPSVRDSRTLVGAMGSREKSQPTRTFRMGEGVLGNWQSAPRQARSC